MPIKRSHCKAHRASTVPVKSFHDPLPLMFYIFKQHVQPVAPIHNELPLLVCLFKRKNT